ncbi:MAG: ATP-binding protein [Bacteroidales bacterium]|nr:ATP-binding protein [Bacteroidales bacterium]
MKYPIGIQSFEKIRRLNYTYIDKTALIYKLAHEGVYYFLSRPRRFGKSLLLSTMAAYFQGRKELFEGLAISELEKEWESYPVLYLDLNADWYNSVEALTDRLGRALSQWEGLYGSDPNERSLGMRFEGVIRRAAEKEGKQVVVLVDEYDKPLLQALQNADLKDTYRNILKAFYGALKSSDRYIRFAFLTGATKFGKVSVFSDLNHLSDISMLPQYVEICGLTEKELHSYFDESVGQLAEANGLSKEECYAELKRSFDGYCFYPNTAGIYNPFSLLNTLHYGVFSDYWFETGTPSFLVEQLKKTNYPLEEMSKEDLSSDMLNSIDIIDENPLPLLYQSGYLTIKKYDSRFKTYLLGFPNREVEEGFIKYLVPYYTPKNENKSATSIMQFVGDIDRGNAENFMKRLEAFFAGGDYALMGNKELYFHNALYVFFSLLGLYVEVERHTSDGRMDMLVQTKDYIYIIEIKIDKDADVALRQIEEKGYARPFEADTRKLYKIGINFSTEKRCIDGWKIAEKSDN